MVKRLGFRGTLPVKYKIDFWNNPITASILVWNQVVLNQSQQLGYLNSKLMLSWDCPFKSTLDRPYCLISTHKWQWEVGRVPRYRAHYCLSSNAVLLRSRQARARLRIPRTACLTSSSSIDWAKDSMVSFRSTSVVLGVFFWALLWPHSRTKSRGGGTSPDSWPATGAWSGSWWLPPNVLLFSQLLALIVVWRRLAGTSKSHMFQGSGMHLCLEEYFYSKLSREPSRAN